MGKEYFAEYTFFSSGCECGSDDRQKVGFLMIFWWAPLLHVCIHHNCSPISNSFAASGVSSVSTQQPHPSHLKWVMSSLFTKVGWDRKLLMCPDHVGSDPDTEVWLRPWTLSTNALLGGGSKIELCSFLRGWLICFLLTFSKRSVSTVTGEGEPCSLFAGVTVAWALGRGACTVFVSPGLCHGPWLLHIRVECFECYFNFLFSS